MVTGEQVRAAAMSAGLTYIPHHECSLCGQFVAYTVHDGSLYFNPACGCSWSPAEPRTWGSAADWINMQTNEDTRAQIMEKFGMMTNVAVHPAEGRREAPLPRVGCNGLLCVSIRRIPLQSLTTPQAGLPSPPVPLPRQLVNSFPGRRQEPLA